MFATSSPQKGIFKTLKQKEMQIKTLRSIHLHQVQGFCHEDIVSVQQQAKLFGCICMGKCDFTNLGVRALTEAIRRSSMHHTYMNRPGLKAENKPVWQ